MYCSQRLLMFYDIFYLTWNKDFNNKANNDQLDLRNWEFIRIYLRTQK